MRAKRSQAKPGLRGPNGLSPGPHLAIQVWQKRHLALRGRVSCRDPAVPVRWVRCCSCSRMAIPSRDPGTRLQGATEWCYHSRQAGTPARATNPRTGGRLTQRPAGSNPRTGQAAVLFFLHCRHLHVHPRLWRFRVRGRMRQCYNGLGLGIFVLDGIGMVYRVLIFLFRSSPSLSSSVRLYFSLPIAAPRAENSRGTVPCRSMAAEGISCFPCRDRASRVFLIDSRRTFHCVAVIVL